MSTPESPQTFPMSMVAIFYGLLAALAFGLSWLFLDDVEIWWWHDLYELSSWLDACIGVGLGLLAVVVSQWLDRIAEWARALTETFKELLGNLSVTDITGIALASSIGEELFFRGFLQRALTEGFGGLESTGAVVAALVLSNVIFAALHVGPGRKYLPWTVMALIMGAAFGLMFYYTGNVFAPILAHFTINFFNLLLMQDPEEPQAPEP